MKEKARRNYKAVARVLAMMLACILLIGTVPVNGIAGSIADIPSAFDTTAEGNQKTLIFNSADYTVTVRYDDAANIPEGTELIADEILPGTSEYQTLYSQLDTSSVGIVRFFDISFVYQGVSIEPEAQVDVEISYAFDEQDEADISVVHFTDNGFEDIPVQSGDNNTLCFKSDSFSIYGTVYTGKLKKTISAFGGTYTVTVSYDRDAGIPDDAWLLVDEVEQGDEDYQLYVDRSNEMIEEGLAISQIHLFDIKIMTVDGIAEPVDEAQFKVNITFSPDDTEEFDGEVKTIHFGEEEQTLLEATAEENTVEFNTDGFSVFAIIETTIEKTILASDGHNYRITVTYGPEAGIPEGADLDAYEILPEEEPVDGVSDFDKYAEKTREVLGSKSDGFEYIRIFDIKIVDEFGDKVEIQAPVSVMIELADKDTDVEAAGRTQLIHCADGAETGEVVEIMTVDGNTVSFEAEGFSAYVIVQDPTMALVGNQVEDVSDLNDTNGFYIFNKYSGYAYALPRVASSKISTSTNSASAGLYYFESTGEPGKFKIYYKDNSGKHYIRTKDNETKFYQSTEAENADYNYVFTVKESTTTENMFHISSVTNTEGEKQQYYWYYDGSGITKRKQYVNGDEQANGNPATVNAQYQGRAEFVIFSSETHDDPYNLDGKTYGLLNWSGGISARAMMSSDATKNANARGVKGLTVMVKEVDHEQKLFVPADILYETVAMWTFEWVSGDTYYLKTDGQYLDISSSGVTMSSSPVAVKVVPGTGVHAGEVMLQATDGSNKLLVYSGDHEQGFGIDGSVGDEYLYLIAPEENTDGYVKTYSANKVSVSDPIVDTGQQVVIYTRFWNKTESRYDFYAVNKDGMLVPCYESGDSIEWIGDTNNDMLWQFTQYYYDDNTPNAYSELYNFSSGMYIAPSVKNDTIVSSQKPGIIMSGRRNEEYYSTIVAWDGSDYHYSGLKTVEVKNDQGLVIGMRVVPCSIYEAEDFYFAVMEDIPIDDSLNTVPTIDNAQYGITMKLVDIKNHTEGDRAYMASFFGSDLQTASNQLKNEVPDLLTRIMDDPEGYPQTTTTKHETQSLADLYSGEADVNHLFIASTYEATGYFEFDSHENFASLDGRTSGDFTVYKEIGSTDVTEKPTLKHGQFFPYNTISPGRFCSINRENLYPSDTTVSGNPPQLSEYDPRKYEKLYLIDQSTPNYQFGMEVTARFDQTPSGLDAWGHDIIFEFSGDDDFWLYVDGNLVIDLGGIHSALPGSVNFRTGKVYVNHKEYTLRELFEDNYRKTHTGASEDEVANYLLQYFEPGETVFRDNTHHVMRIFYFERGAGASNLHMRFNLATVEKGTVQLTKKLGNIDANSSVNVKIPYQIIYKKEDGEWYYLENVTDPEEGSGSGTGTTHYPHEQDPETQDRVFYANSTRPVEFLKSVDIAGVTYRNVFLLKMTKPEANAIIKFPNGAVEYKIIECGISNDVYDTVKIDNVTQTTGSRVISSGTYQNGYYDYPTPYNPDEYSNILDRPKVTYENSAKSPQILEIKKRLYFAREGENPVQLTPEEEAATTGTFDFRLFFGTQFDDDMNNGAYLFTYYIKDKEGYYVYKDHTTNSAFVRIRDDETGKNFSALTTAEKQKCSSQTGTNGSISQIPAGYTVEVRDILVGTPFRLAEYARETGDGFEWFQYEVTQRDGTNETSVSTITLTPTTTDPTKLQDDGILGNIVADKTSVVYVDNIKGYGLRLNKTWADADEISNRDSAWFAVFVQDGDDLVYVENSLKELKLLDDEGEAIKQTLYWYYDLLPAGVDELTDLVVREVLVTKEEVNGVMTQVVVTPITPIENDGYVTLDGTHVTSSTPESINYQVTYANPVLTDNHVLTYGVTNTPKQPSIIMKKVQWDGVTPLNGATFTLEFGTTGNEYISSTVDGVDGIIAILYPKVDEDYTLTETASPEQWQGVDHPITIKLNSDGTVSAYPDPDKDEWYILEQASSEDAPAILYVKDRPFEFEVIKKDGLTQAPISGVQFDLSRYIQTGVNVYAWQSPYQPADTGDTTDYSKLVTGADGIVPHVDNNLPVGTYRLREWYNDPNHPGYHPGYQPLDEVNGTYNSTVVFKIDELGEISFEGDQPEGVSIECEADENGVAHYTLTILNYPQVTILKTDESGNELAGAQFKLTTLTANSEWVAYNGGGVSNGLISLTDEASLTITYLPDGRYCLTETRSPNGFILLSEPVYFKILRNANEPMICLTDADGNVLVDENQNVLNTYGNATLITNNTGGESGTGGNAGHGSNTGDDNGQGTENGESTEPSVIVISVKNKSGVALPNTGGTGTGVYALAGVMLMLFACVALALKRRGNYRV